MKRLSIICVAALAVLGLCVSDTIISTKPIPRTGPSTVPERRKYKSYDYAEVGKKLRLTVPDSLVVVRGILVVGPWSGGDSRDLYREAWYREFMHLHDFAFLGAESLNSHAESFKVMQNALKQLFLLHQLRERWMERETEGTDATPKAENSGQTLRCLGEPVHGAAPKK